MKTVYETSFGKAYVAESLQFMRSIAAGSVNLVMTSRPYALHFKKEYGNADQADYIKWFLPFPAEIHRMLADDGSFVLDIGPTRTANGCFLIEASDQEMEPGRS